jgi:sarcosine oxidase
MSDSYVAIVVGLGAMGSAATYQLARRGQRVLGLEMFEPGHDQGSSHGYHRMIRMASVQDDGYVPLAARAFELWAALEEETGQELLRLTGEVRLVSAATRPDFAATAETMRERGHWEILDRAALAARFPGIRLHDGMIATYEAQAGFLRSEGGILAHVAAARQHGATIATGEEVTGWASDGDGVRVETRRGSYRAARLILTTGPWAAELLNGVTFPMKVIRTVNGYFAPTRPEHWSAATRPGGFPGAPDFLLDVPEGDFYGMPAVEGVGVKIGRSRLLEGPATTARTIRRAIDQSEIDLLRAVLDRYLPGASGEELRRMTCMCTYTVDGDFIVDRHPRHPQVILGCGFSGRGFKFSPTIGEILADLALDGATRHAIGFLAADRFAREEAAD